MEYLGHIIYLSGLGGLEGQGWGHYACFNIS
jgi:hypothetical protein